MVKLNICLNGITAFILSKVKTVGQSSNPGYIKKIYTGIALPQKTIINWTINTKHLFLSLILKKTANTHGELTITIFFFFWPKVFNHFRARKWKSSKKAVLLSDKAKFRHEAGIYGEKYWRRS